MCIHIDYTLRFACLDATVRSVVLLPVKLLTVLVTASLKIQACVVKVYLNLEIIFK